MIGVAHYFLPHIGSGWMWEKLWGDSETPSPTLGNYIESDFKHTIKIDFAQQKRALVERDRELGGEGVDLARGLATRVIYCYDLRILCLVNVSRTGFAISFCDLFV